MNFINEFFSFEIAGNPLWRILILFCIILMSFIIGRIIRFLIERSSRGLETQKRLNLAITLKATAKGIVFLFAAIGISLGLVVLGLKEKVAEIAGTVSAIFLSISVGYFLYWLVDIPSELLARLSKGEEDKLDNMLVPLVRKSLRITVIILVLIQIAQILSDKPLTSIIAGLGIGGLAFALAAQDTIKNIFGSIVLYVDKPFEIGDRVLIDGHDGPVEEVGLRSTKIRTLDGHLVTIPNGELANKTIKNIGKRPYIRRLLNITITYDTPPEKIDRALEILKNLLENHEGMNENFPPRVFFSDFNSDSLNLMMIYWYHPPDYWAYMIFTENLNKTIFKKFNEEGIDFAFPTQTLFLAGDRSRPLNLTLHGKKAEDSEL